MHPWIENYREWKYEKGSFLYRKANEEEDHQFDMEQDTSHTNNQNVFQFNGEEMKQYNE